MSDYIDVLRFAVAVASMDPKMLADVNVPPEEVTTRMRRDMLSRIVQYTRITPELRARLPAGIPLLPKKDLSRDNIAQFLRELAPTERRAS